MCKNNQPRKYDYLESIEGASSTLTHLYYSGRQTEERLEVVVLSQTLSDEVNVGYEALEIVCGAFDVVGREGDAVVPAHAGA